MDTFTEDPFAINDFGNDADQVSLCSDVNVDPFQQQFIPGDEEDTGLALSIDAIAEEGLDEPYDPATETSTCLRPESDSFPHEIAFEQADETFLPVPTQPQKTRTEIPTNSAVNNAIDQLQKILHPPQDSGKGYKIAKISLLLQGHLELMAGFLWLYKASNYTGWKIHADAMAMSAGKGPWLSQKLHEWSIAFCNNPKNLPTVEYGKFNSSILDDEDIRHDIELYLQSLGKWICAMDIVHFVETPEFQMCLKVKKSTITPKTAQRWMEQLNYRWGLEKKDMYEDGHEKEEVVDYQQKKFVSCWKELEKAMRHWTKDGNEEDDAKEHAAATQADGKIVVIWWHDESTFYANDQ